MKWTLESYLSAIQDMYVQNNWLKYPNMRKDINQPFINGGDTDGLMSFYQQAMQATSLDNNIKQQVEGLVHQAQNLSLAGLDDAAILDSDKSKAIYIEYDETIDFFITTEFDKNDDSWASEYKKYVEGCNVSSLLSFYDWDMDASSEFVVSDYMDATLLTSCMRYLQAKAYLFENIHVGFAEHDAPIVILR